MRILITGADGQLGRELQLVLAAHELIPLLWPEFDVLGPDVERHVVDAKPDVVIHAAALTDVDKAELEPDLAMATNAEGTERVARAAARCGARLIYLSTDYVFDGQAGRPYREEDATNPVNVYGKSKLEGERRASACCGDTLVVRTAWLYAVIGRNFVNTIMSRAQEGPELRVVADQFGSPTYARELADVLPRLLEKGAKGIVHAVGAGQCSWQEFAVEILSLIGSSKRVLPISTMEAGRAAPRPPYSVLDTTKLGKEGIAFPHWKNSLSRFMQDRRRGEAPTQVEAIIRR